MSCVGLLIKALSKAFQRPSTSLLKIFKRPFKGLFKGPPGTSQKEGQEDQGWIKELWGIPPSGFKVPWFAWPSFWLFPGIPDNPSNHCIYSLPYKALIVPIGSLGKP